MVLPWFVRYGLEPLRTRRIGLHVLRAVFNVVAMLSFFYALSIAPLAEVTALGFTAPIFATAARRADARRGRAPAPLERDPVGFAGVLFIVRPGLEAVGPGQLLTLGSSLSWACALLVIKTLGPDRFQRHDHQLHGAPDDPADRSVPARSSGSGRTRPSSPGWSLIGLLGGTGQFCMTEALRQADTAVVMPIDFCKLIWVAALAYLAFGEVPDRFTWLGGTVVFASVLYIAYRGRRLAQSPAPGSRTRCSPRHRLGQQDSVKDWRPRIGIHGSGAAGAWSTSPTSTA